MANVHLKWEKLNELMMTYKYAQIAVSKGGLGERGVRCCNAALPQTCCVTPSKTPSLSEAQFPHMETGRVTKPMVKVLLQGFSEIMLVEMPA